MELTVKTTYRDDLRRFRLGNPYDWNLLCSTVSKFYALEFFSLQYQDDEGDIVSVTSPLEYEEAIRLCSMSTPPLLRLIVAETHSTNAVRWTANATGRKEQAELASSGPSIEPIISAPPPPSSQFLQLAGREEARNRSRNYFLDVHTFEDRKAMADRVKIHNTESVPVIVELADGNTAPSLDRCKFLINKKTTVQKFQADMHTLLKAQSKPVYFFVVKGGHFFYLASSDLWLERIYKELVETDGFLYITYSDDASHYSYA